MHHLNIFTDVIFEVQPRDVSLIPHRNVPLQAYPEINLCPLPSTGKDTTNYFAIYLTLVPAASWCPYQIPPGAESLFQPAELSALSPIALEPGSDRPANAPGLVMMGWSNGAISQQLLPACSALDTDAACQM